MHVWHPAAPGCYPVSWFHRWYSNVSAPRTPIQWWLKLQIAWGPAIAPVAQTLPFRTYIPPSPRAAASICPCRYTAVASPPDDRLALDALATAVKDLVQQPHFSDPGRIVGANVAYDILHSAYFWDFPLGAGSSNGDHDNYYYLVTTASAAARGGGGGGNPSACDRTVRHCTACRYQFYRGTP